MQGQYQPYPQMPPGPPGPPLYPPPRRDKANLVPLFIVLGVLAVALLGTFAYVVVRLAGDDGDDGASPIRTTAPADPRAVTATFSGTWYGEGYYLNKKGEKRNFTANIVLQQGAETGTVNYTGYVCSGTLRVESVSPDRIVMVETITQGDEAGGNCENASSGYVTLSTRSDGTMLYNWYGSKAKLDINNTSSQATLSRQQGGATTGT